jgi:hypothetical protein
VFNFLKPKKVVKKEDDDTFIHRIRDEIEEKSAATSGIRVFEHNDDSTLDDYERKILETLRKAHESWIAKHG